VSELDTTPIGSTLPGRWSWAGSSFPGHPGLAGHSDGDAVAHAVIDAMLGAASAGDVGRHFPPGGEEWKDADSMDLLRRAVILLGQERGYRPSNVDVVVVTEEPRGSLPWPIGSVPDWL
jgi:2-C-methyl-D-erythritol 2,4-cyclodiphosphate synthase